jgi:hypothetical protein
MYTSKNSAHTTIICGDTDEPTNNNQQTNLGKNIGRKW